MDNKNSDPSRFRQASRNTSKELDYRHEVDSYIQESAGTYVEKLENFPKYVSRQVFARHIALYEIFKKVIDVQGDIVECGVSWGGALMHFAQMSAVLEPVNFQRRIWGFDTFSGFVDIAKEDRKAVEASTEMRPNGFAADSFDDLKRSIALYDRNRFVGHIPKVTLIKGDASQTIPGFLEKNPHTVVSLLHLDFDLYQPTKVAIEAFLPRMPKGAVIIFDELNNQTWPGETVAVHEVIGIRNLKIQRFPFEPHVSFAVIE